MNRLALASSAYLRSASHQPIHWHPWSTEAFDSARVQDRPVLLDIGAVWCHWCHVMDGESYEDPALAAFLNENFICIKVDRDERPDVDTRYQRAVQAIAGQGGWPLTAFLTPDGDVFFGGTYFPPDGKYGRPGFRSVLEQVLHVYRTQRDRVTTQGGAIRRMLSEHLDEAKPGSPSEGLLLEATDRIAKLFDTRFGGFGSQPKFPHPAAMTFLLHRHALAPDPKLRSIVDLTLVGMARGGIHDQLGGGFHRYSVDARWIVPHFEKMSYDNAELLKAYLDGFTASGSAEYATVARGIVNWVRAVLSDPEGGYGASQDADVGLDDDGDYFTWTVEEAAEALSPEELAVAGPYYDIGTAGEMHHNPGKNVLFVSDSLDAIATREGLDLATARTRLDSASRKLLAAREARTAPFVDRTRYTSWNGMLAAALLRAGVILPDKWAVEHALITLHRIRSEQAIAGALAHSPGGKGGLLDDQVQVAAAAIEAYEVTGDVDWLRWSEMLLDRVWEQYADDDGALFDVAKGGAGEGLLPTRAKPIQDAPTPSPNGVAALGAARLAELTGAPRWAERRDRLVAACSGSASELGLYGATLLLAVDWVVHPATHVVVVEGPESDGAMHRAVFRSFLPRRVIHRLRQSEPNLDRLPAAVRPMLNAATGESAFLCVGTRCLAPARTPAEWSERVKELNRAL